MDYEEFSRDVAILLGAWNDIRRIPGCLSVATEHTKKDLELHFTVNSFKRLSEGKQTLTRERSTKECRTEEYFMLYGCVKVFCIY